MSKGFIVVDGVRYYVERPSNCSGCFFWKNRKAGCIIGKHNCYYLAESPEPESACDGCGYGPCVGTCVKKILEVQKNG